MSSQQDAAQDYFDKARSFLRGAGITFPTLDGSADALADLFQQLADDTEHRAYQRAAERVRADCRSQPPCDLHEAVAVVIERGGTES